MKLSFALVLLLAILGSFLSTVVEAGKSSSSSTIRAGKTGGAAERQAAKAAREERRIIGVDKGK
uniref:Putative salivary basic peptide 4.2k-1 n=1 Tax=Aedes albopictus TaxID=7160 RepID=Q5MIT6_AEDAL|nr:putative salivary basic peptide 4.2k-1 [Aedes albopictus]